MASFFRKSSFIFIGLLFSLNAFGRPTEGQPDGWQFTSFFGTYKVLESQGDCKSLGSIIKVGKIGSASTPSIGFMSVFQTDRPIWISLRTESYETCSSDYGQPCNGAAPDIWTHSSLAGDGINNAVFFKREKNFSSPEYTLVLEMVRVDTERVALKYNACVLQLVRD